MADIAPKGRIIDDRYRIDDEIGAGGMGEVYRARQVNVERDVALKLLPAARVGDERAVEQFLTETRAVSRLTSPHTVTLYDAGRLEDGAPFLAMELLEGGTLRARLAKGRCPLNEALRIIEGVTLSLAEAHARGIVHRDIKPSNVFLAHTPGHPPTVKVLDFGLARLEGVTTTEGRAAGTLRYMAPEAIRGEDIDARADVYALGMLAYEVLAGAHPFDALDRESLRRAQLEESPPLITDVSDLDLPPAAAKLVATALAKPKRLRPRDAGVFLAKLRQAFDMPAVISSGEAEHATPGDAIELPSETVLSRTLATMPAVTQPRRVGRVALALTAAAALGAFAYGVRPRETSTPTPPAASARSAVISSARALPVPSTPSSAMARPARSTTAPSPSISASASRVQPKTARTRKPPVAQTPPAPAPSIDPRVRDYLE